MPILSEKIKCHSINNINTKPTQNKQKFETKIKK